MLESVLPGDYCGAQAPYTVTAILSIQEETYIQSSQVYLPTSTSTFIFTWTDITYATLTPQWATAVRPKLFV